jgi:hypothetical protein
MSLDRTVSPTGRSLPPAIAGPANHAERPRIGCPGMIVGLVVEKAFVQLGET